VPPCSEVSAAGSTGDQDERFGGGRERGPKAATAFLLMILERQDGNPSVAGMVVPEGYGVDEG